MNSPRLFSPEVSADLDVIGGITGVAPSCVDAAALTVLAGITGSLIKVRGVGGEPMPLCVLTAVMVPPLFESLRLARLLTRDIEEHTAGIFAALGPSRHSNARSVLAHAGRQEAFLRETNADHTHLSDLHRQVAEARLALSEGLVANDPGLGGISAKLECAHRQSLFVTFGHNHLLGQLASHKDLLSEFLRFGVHGQLSLKKAPDSRFAVGSLAIMQRAAAMVFLGLRTADDEPVPFMLIDEPGGFGGTAFDEPPVLSAWPALALRVVHERMHGEERMLTLSPGAGVVVTKFLNDTIEPLTAANPALGAFLAPAVAVLVRSAAVLALAREITAAVVDDNALTTAAAFCRHWVSSHARALALHLPKPSKPRRLLVVQPNLEVDRNILLDHLRRQVGARWRNIRMNLPKGRRHGHWEARLAELERDGQVIMTGRTVSATTPTTDKDKAPEGNGADVQHDQQTSTSLSQ